MRCGSDVASPSLRHSCDHMATSILYPNGGTRQGRSPRKGLAPAGPWAGPAPQPLTFIDRPWARPGLPNPSLLSTGPGPAQPPQSLTFIDRPWASPAPKPSLLLARPLTSISQSWPSAGFRPKPFRGPLLRKESLSEQNRDRQMVCILPMASHYTSQTWARFCELGTCV